MKEREIDTFSEKMKERKKDKRSVMNMNSKLIPKIVPLDST